MRLGTVSSSKYSQVEGNKGVTELSLEKQAQRQKQSNRQERHLGIRISTEIGVGKKIEQSMSRSETKQLLQIAPSNHNLHVFVS